eukprot:NODE_66_length_25735_cov_0.318497.p15 type:complete len:290 gc:universal NODE_66_length_25735_cov_0.318497:10597-9728(-)
MMTSFYCPLYSSKTIWGINEKDHKLFQASLQFKNFKQIPEFDIFQERCIWAILKLTSKLYRLELNGSDIKYAIRKWLKINNEPLVQLLLLKSEIEVDNIYKMITLKSPWLSLVSADMINTLKWLETCLIVLRFNPVRVRFPDDKFCPTLYTLDLVKICSKTNNFRLTKQSMNRLFENLRDGCKKMFDPKDLLFIDPLQYLISVNQEKYKEMIKWVSIADGMRSSFIQLLHFGTVQEAMIDKLYAWIYKICLYMRVQDIWTEAQLNESLELLWNMKLERCNDFLNLVEMS